MVKPTAAKADGVASSATFERHICSGNVVASVANRVATMTLAAALSTFSAATCAYAEGASVAGKTLSNGEASSVSANAASKSIPTAEPEDATGAASGHASESVGGIASERLSASGPASTSAAESESEPTSTSETDASYANEPATALASNSEIVDQSSLFAALESNPDAVSLNASFSIDKPIPIPDGGSFALSLSDGCKLTCTGSSVFESDDDATIVVSGHGSIDADACGFFASVPSGCSVSVSQYGESAGTPDGKPSSISISASGLFGDSISPDASISTNWAYEISAGSLSLSKTIDVGEGCTFNVHSGAQFTSTANCGIRASSNNLILKGTTNFKGTGFELSNGAKLVVSDGAFLNASGDLIVAKNGSCDVILERGANMVASNGALLKVESAGDSGSSAMPKINAEAGLILCDGTVAPYLQGGMVEVFNLTSSEGSGGGAGEGSGGNAGEGSGEGPCAGVFRIVKCTSPSTQGWYGSIGDVWCPTMADYDALLSKMSNAAENCTWYTVSFVGSDGSAIDSLQVRKGHCVGDPFTSSAPKAPEVAGKKFVYWDDGEGDLLNAENPVSTPVTDDKVYTAVYEDSGDNGGGEGGVGPDKPGPDKPPVDPGPVNPGPGSGTGGGGGQGGAIGQGGSGGAGSSGAGAGGPSLPASPATPWNPPGLALAAGFTVPSSGAGVQRARREGPVPAGAAGEGEAAAGPLGPGSDALASAIYPRPAGPQPAVSGSSQAPAGGSVFDAAPPSGAPGPLGLAVPLGMAGATALAAFIMARAAGFSVANAEAAKKAKRARKRGRGLRSKRAKAGA